MAKIYLARQTGLGSFERHVVLKMIQAEHQVTERCVTMFLDEARLAATLHHQNIAQVFEVDQTDDGYFMAMEYVHGETMRLILETAAQRALHIPLELAIMIVTSAASGLHHAHERKGKHGQPLNVVHRDVSPANIMVGYDGSVKVLDFGIAKAEERATKTAGGVIKGKYGYMSPEQCKGRAIDRRSDIFALGICLYELTTLRRAFKGADDYETMKRIVTGDVLLPSDAVAGYPRELEAIVVTAMATNPNARFQTAQEMIGALDALAVRAKHAGSSTALGRFMAQMFGSKKEPWVDEQDREVHLITDADVVADDASTMIWEVENEATITRTIADMTTAAAEFRVTQLAPSRPSPAAAGTAGPKPQRLLPAATLLGPGAPVRVSDALVASNTRTITDTTASAMMVDRARFDTPSPGLATPPEASRPGSRGWIVLVILMFLGFVAGVAIAISTQGDVLLPP